MIEQKSGFSVVHAEEINSEPYPYANQKTFEFLQAVIREGAHKKLPKRLTEANWARRKNITGLYYSCDIDQAEIGAMYVVTTQRVNQLIKKTLHSLWENSSVTTKALFPKIMVGANPSTHRRVQGIGRMDGFELKSLIRGSFDDNTISQRNGLDLKLTRQMMRRAGRKDLITTAFQKNMNAVEALESLPFENYADRQNAMYKLNSKYVFNNRQLFASISEVALLFGKKLPRRYTKTDQFVSELKGMGVPVGITLAGYDKYGKQARYIFIWRGDYLRLQENSQSSINPAETPGPTS